jgi:hypothetical protein
MNPNSTQFEKTLAEQMYEVYHERMFDCVPSPLETRTEHTRETWNFLASMAVGFVMAADVKPEHPQPSVN